MRYYLLPCTKTKLPHPAPARDLYSASGYWCALWSYYQAAVDAQTRDDWMPGKCYDRAFVVSAKHGLLPLDSDLPISPYELRVDDLDREETAAWAELVRQQLIEQSRREPWKGEDWGKRKPMGVVWMLPKSYQKHLKPIFNGDWDDLPDELAMMNRHHFPFDGLGGIGAIKSWCLKRVEELGGIKRRPPLIKKKKQKKIEEEPQPEQMALF